ncbi:MAG TPA: imidazolonepropionase [Nitrospiraceae bacterium]|nr:imidazolonepropionase [Nitrospiraceae bacterium]
MSVIGGQALLIFNCGQVLTLRGPRRPRIGREMEALGILRKGAVLIKGRAVAMVGPQDRLARSPEARKAHKLDAGGRVVLPGFVDSHTHALFAAPRLDEYEARIRGASYGQIARAGGGIQASARSMRAASERVLAAQLEKAIGLFLEHGTTTVEVKSGYGLDFAQELKMLRVIRASARGPLDLIPTLLVHDVPARFKATRRRFLDAVIHHLIPRVARDRLADFFDVFCDRGYFSLSETKALLEAAAQAGLKLKLHADQLARSGAALLGARYGAVSVDHLDHVGNADIRRLRGTGTIATLLPGTVLHLGSGPYPPARQLIQGGIPVALATNFNPGSCPTPNMQMILTLACSQMRMSPAEAITAATINGAYAVGRGDRVGSLEIGKQADLAIMDVSDYREIPYFFGMNHCHTVITKGRVAYQRTT